MEVLKEIIKYNEKKIKKEVKKIFKFLLKQDRQGDYSFEYEFKQLNVFILEKNEIISVCTEPFDVNGKPINVIEAQEEIIKKLKQGFEDLKNAIEEGE